MLRFFSFWLFASSVANAITESVGKNWHTSHEKTNFLDCSLNLENKNGLLQNSYWCTYDLYGPARKVFDA